MNGTDMMLLAVIRDHEPTDYATISMASRLDNQFLGPRLDDLQSRGFIELRHNRYSLARGVADHLTQSM